MQKQVAIWQLILNSLQKNIAIMLLYVLESKGSSPGRQGFFMAVNAEGEMLGSMGGGIMEHKFVELAKATLQKNKEENSIHQQVHDKAAAKNQSGMICSGEQTIFLHTIKKEEATAIEALINSLEENKNGTLQLSPQGISFSSAIPTENYFLEMKGEDDFTFKEKTGYKNKLYIIGGGHCALALSRLISGMDFYIHLYEEREGLNTMEQNNFVHEKMVVADYSELKQLIPSGKNSYVVIMTFGYRTDYIAVKALIGKHFTYTGLLGSSNKIQKMFENLQEESVDKKILDDIYAPIGLQIRSQTPEEIAISIAAEIIGVKNSLLP